MAQMGFFDLSNRYASLDAKKDPLLEIDAVVPWEEFRPALERIWRKPDTDRKSRAGQKPIDAVLMFKTLVLSALYNLSDDQIEYQIRDRLSFMRFLGLGLGDRVPDAKTVWLYRDALAQAGKVEELFQLFDHCPAGDCKAICREGDVSDVCAPNLIGSINHHIPKQIRPDLVLWMLLAPVWLLINRNQPHEPHQRVRAMAAACVVVALHVPSHLARSVPRRL